MITNTSGRVAGSAGAKRMMRTILCGGAAFAALTTASAAWAQNADGDIVVTARRVEERLQDVPISITVYNQEQLSKANIFNAADLGTYTPSLATNSRFGAEKASFAIRGFTQDLATGPSVGVYFADVVAPRSGGSTTAGGGVGIGNLFDLQNVQVLKGPQGTLFGRNTTGGAVLLVPQKPTDKLEGYVEGSAGNYDMKRLQGVVNLPVTDAVRVRLGVDHMEREGYLKNHTNIGPGRLGDVDYLAARFSVVADLAPNLENYTILTYSKSDNHGIVPRVVGCNPLSALQSFACGQVNRQRARGDGWWDVENTEPDPKLEMETWQAINTTTWEATDTLTVKNIISYAEFYETTRTSLDGEAFLLPSGAAALTLIRLNNTPGHHNSSQSTFTEEFQLQGRSSDDRFNWQAGVYYESSDPIGITAQFTPFLLNCPNAFAYQCFASASGNISSPYQQTWFESKGAYAQGTYNFTEQLSLTAGIRYTQDEQTHTYNGLSITFPTTNTPRFICSNTVRVRNPDGSAPVVVGSAADFARCNATFTAASEKPTWLIDLDYKLTDDVLLYGKYSRGYRAGGVASANVFFETWEPEKVDAYELGAKTSFRGDIKGYFNIAAFYNDFANQQLQGTLIAKPGSPLLGGSAILNAGKSTIWGIEVDASVSPLKGLKFDVGYTYLNTELTELAAQAPCSRTPFVIGTSPWDCVVPTAVQGGPLSLSPENRYTITGTYTLPLDENIGRVSVGATYVHTDEQVASLATAARFQKLPDTDLLNLNASWDQIAGRPVDLSIFATNVTEEEFPVNVTNAWNSFGFESQITNEPRMYGVRLKYHFGG